MRNSEKNLSSLRSILWAVGGPCVPLLERAERSGAAVTKARTVWWWRYAFQKHKETLADPWPFLAQAEPIGSRASFLRPSLPHFVPFIGFCFLKGGFTTRQQFELLGVNRTALGTTL